MDMHLDHGSLADYQQGVTQVRQLGPQSFDIQPVADDQRLGIIRERDLGGGARCSCLPRLFGNGQRRGRLEPIPPERLEIGPENDHQSLAAGIHHPRVFEH